MTSRRLRRLASRLAAAGAGGVKTQRARRVLLALGFVCGAGLMGGFVAAVLLLRANASGAEGEGRHRLAARLAWIRSGEWRRAAMIDVSAEKGDNRDVETDDRGSRLPPCGIT